MKALLPLTLAATMLAMPVALAQDGEAGAKKIKVQDVKKAKVFKVGTTIPAELQLIDINGKVHTMKELRGKTVFIGFWSIECPYLKNAEPKMAKIFADYNKKDVIVLGINSNVTEIGVTAPVKTDKIQTVAYGKIQKHVKTKKVPFTIIADHGNVLANRFDAKTTPHCFVIDKKGVVQYAGGLDNDPQNAKGAERKDYVRLALDAVLAGEKVTLANTKPYGCAIKKISAKKKIGDLKKKKKKDGA